MKTLKIAVIGCGGIANAVHLPAHMANNNVEIAALCDIDEKKLLKASREYNVKSTYTDYRNVLDREDIDAVDICTPNYLHSIISVEALNKGKHVFCEKPDAINPDEALKMKTASENSGKLLMVMRNNRFREDMKFLKQFIDTDGCGEIYAAKCGWVRRRGIPGKGGWFTTKAQSGGGPLIDLGVHMIDLSIWLMGNPRPVSVTGSTYCKFADNKAPADSEHTKFGDAKDNGIFDVEDLAMGFIKFDNGASLALEFSWASNIESEDHYVEILGTKAGAKVHSDGKGLKIFGEINGVLTQTDPLINRKTEFPGAHAKNLNHFVDCILKGSKPIFIPQQGYDMIRILNALYKSADTGREVILG